MNNQFKDRMEELSDIELFRVLKQRNDYQDLAVEAAESEINRRNFSKAQITEISAQIEAMEPKRKVKRYNYLAIKKKIISMIDIIIVPINFSSPSLFINSIGVLIIINVLWRFGALELIYYSLKFGDHSYALRIFAIMLITVGFATLLFTKKRTGWMVLNLLIIYPLVNELISLYTTLFVLNIGHEAFVSISGWLYFTLEIILPLIIVNYLNKNDVLNYFKISKTTQKLVLVICIIISIFLGFLLL